jgi:hypothetical protein
VGPVRAGFARFPRRVFLARFVAALQLGDQLHHRAVHRGRKGHSFARAHAAAHAEPVAQGSKRVAQGAQGVFPREGHLRQLKQPLCF